jgi:hypothetical protein
MHTDILIKVNAEAGINPENSKTTILYLLGMSIGVKKAKYGTSPLGILCSK